MPMILIKDLGRYRKEGTSAVKRYGVYECSFCKSRIEACTYDIKSGQTNSCGCKMGRIRHGKSRTRIYGIWNGIKVRCNDKSNRNYGAKGIDYDPKWNTFEGFLDDMAEGYADNLEIDRIDSSKGYYKDNCQWITRSENAGKDRRKLTVEQVQWILWHKKMGTYSHGQMANIMNVSRSTIQQIVERRSYKWVDIPYIQPIFKCIRDDKNFRDVD